MTRIQDLRTYATHRKLPKATFLGNLSNDWVSKSLDHCSALPSQLQTTVTERNSIPIHGTKIYYDQLEGIYDQRKISLDVHDLDPIIIRLQGVNHLRYALLNPKSTIPAHLDDPYTLRFICMLQGKHILSSEGTDFEMTAGELWFVNGSYKHSIFNSEDYTRIALLGNFAYSDFNINMLRSI
jgi:quercetin dioxygenase-like cupin family protein